MCTYKAAVFLTALGALAARLHRSIHDANAFLSKVEILNGKPHKNFWGGTLQFLSCFRDVNVIRCDPPQTRTVRSSAYIISRICSFNELLKYYIVIIPRIIFISFKQNSKCTAISQSEVLLPSLPAFISRNIFPVFYWCHICLLEPQAGPILRYKDHRTYTIPLHGTYLTAGREPFPTHSNFTTKK